MMKLRKIDSGMYCFLLTFDPNTELVNIVDLQSKSSGSLPAQPTEVEILSADKTVHQTADIHAIKQNSLGVQASSAKLVETVAQPKGIIDDKVAATVSKAKNAEPVPKQTEAAKSARELRPHDILSRREAAAYLGVSEQTLAIWKCTGRYNLPFLKVSRLVKYKLCRIRHNLYLMSFPMRTYGRSYLFVHFQTASVCSATPR